MPDQIPEKVKKQRRKRLMEIQHKISLERNQAQVGKTIEVLLESYDPSKMHYIGRSQWDAPGIDNLVYIKDKTNSLPIGEFREVEITQAKPYDLIAKPLGATQDHDEAAESEFKVIALVE
jgi:ribosomal protein S12 methylthiotransferase